MTQELYALASDRSARNTARFLDRFAPRRAASSDDFPIPELSDHPRLVLSTEAEILGYLEHHVSENYGLYWNNVDPTPAGRAVCAQAMAFYTTDGAVIFGLAVHPDLATERLAELAAFVGATHRMFGSEQRPPDTAAEFSWLCRKCEP